MCFLVFEIERKKAVVACGQFNLGLCSFIICKLFVECDSYMNNKGLQFLPYGRSIGSFICLRRHIYMSHILLLPRSGIDHDFVSVVKKIYSFCLMVEASDHLYVLGDTYTCHTYYCYLSPV
jgi:hypothetical protein